MHLGDKLKLYRKAKDLDQIQMAELIGVSVRTYGEIEKKGIVLKAQTHSAIRKILADDQQKSSERQSLPENEESHLQIIAKLTASVEYLAQSTKNLVKNNTQLVQSNSQLVRKVMSSGGPGVTDSAVVVEQKDIDERDLPLSGNKANRKKQRGILKTAGK